MKPIDENLLREVITEMHQEIEPRNDAQERFRKRLAMEESMQRVRARVRRRLFLLVAAAAATLLTILRPPVVYSAMRTVYDQLEIQIRDKFTTIRVWMKPGSPPDEIDPQPGPVGELGQLPAPEFFRLSSMSEAQTVVPLPLLQPLTLPPDTFLTEVTVKRQRMHPTEERFRFTVGATYKSGSVMWQLTQDHHPGAKAYDIGAYSTKQWTTDVVEVRGAQGYYQRAQEEKTSRLGWYEGPWAVTLSGDLTREELLAIAQALWSNRP